MYCSFRITAALFIYCLSDQCLANGCGNRFKYFDRGGLRPGRDLCSARPGRTQHGDGHCHHCDSVYWRVSSSWDWDGCCRIMLHGCRRRDPSNTNLAGSLPGPYVYHRRLRVDRFAGNLPAPLSIPGARSAFSCADPWGGDSINLFRHCYPAIPFLSIAHQTGTDLYAGCPDPRQHSRLLATQGQ